MWLLPPAESVATPLNHKQGQNIKWGLCANGSMMLENEKLIFSCQEGHSWQLFAFLCPTIRSFRFRAVRAVCTSQHCALFGDYAITMHAQIGGMLIRMSVNERGGRTLPQSDPNEMGSSFDINSD